ncbi:phage baseplate assembly protein V, partial [Mariniblastus sp.]|nr:phage baseplate assembly protein V [Mariniblastus sp.]
PEFHLWPESKKLIGSQVSISLDSGDDFKGKCWGRRVSKGQNSQQGTLITIFGYDESFKLIRPARFRGLEKGNLRSALEKICSNQNVKFQFDHSVAGRFSSSDTQFVQYGESDFEFLLRFARMTGAYVWPFRGKVYFGRGPGDGGSVSVDISGGEIAVTGIQLIEDWSDSEFGSFFPTRGAPFQSSPELETTDQEPSSFSGEGSDVASNLLANQSSIWPTGYSSSSGDQAKSNEAILALQKIQRELGAITIQGSPPSGVKLGSKIELSRSSETLISDAVVTGLRHFCEGGNRNTAIQFGRPGDFTIPRVDSRPAKHCWPAKVVGEFEAKRARMKVQPLGWHSDSQPIAARILAGSSAKLLEVLHIPKVDELVLIGFESGNPDAPFILGSLFDKESIQGGDSDVSWRVRTPDGEMRVIVEKQKIKVDFDKLELELSAAKITTKSEDDISFESSANIDIKAAKKINLQK